MAKAALEASTIFIDPVDVRTETYHILGLTPFLNNQMALKALREFLFPAGKKRSDADRAGRLKHLPEQEYRDSALLLRDPDEPTYLGCPSTAVKGSLMTAALDSPGIKRTEIGRLCWVEGLHLNLYGPVKIYLSPVRSADINRTPDIRTRAIMPVWCAEVTITYVQPKLDGRAMLSLLLAAGLTCGIGDGRQEKGKLNFGQFTPVNESMTKQWQQYQRIKEQYGRAEQIEMIKHPEPFDDQSATLLTWFDSELDRRGKRPAVNTEEWEPDPVDVEREQAMSARHRGQRTGPIDENFGQNRGYQQDDPEEFREEMGADELAGLRNARRRAEEDDEDNVTEAPPRGRAGYAARPTGRADPEDGGWTPNDIQGRGSDEYVPPRRGRPPGSKNKPRGNGMYT